jgi:acyl carrier protein
MLDMAAVRKDLMDMISGTLSVPTEAINDEFSAENCETWDSLKHLMLVLAVEDRFRITFDEGEIWSLKSFPALREAVARLLQSQCSR